MYCPNCGAPVPDGSSFCTNCGNKLAGANSPTNDANAPTLYEYPSQTPVVADDAAAPTLYEYPNQTPGAADDAAAPTLYEYPNETPKATDDANAPTLYEYPSQTPRVTNEDAAPTVIDTAPRIPKPPAAAPTAPTPAPGPTPNGGPTPAAAAPVSTPVATTTAEKRKQIVAEAEQSGLGMKWYKFLIYFGLIAAAVVSGFQAVTYVTGSRSLSDTAANLGMIHRTYSTLMVVYIILAIVYAGMAVLYVLTRMRLSRFSKLGPTLIYACYAVNGAANAFYYIALTAVTGTFVWSYAVTAIFAIGISALMIVLNWMYFKKRAHLFVNE